MTKNKKLLFTAEVTTPDGVQKCFVYSNSGAAKLVRQSRSGLEEKLAYTGHRTIDDLTIDIADWFKVDNSSVRVLL